MFFNKRKTDTHKSLAERHGIARHHFPMPIDINPCGIEEMNKRFLSLVFDLKKSGHEDIGHRLLQLSNEYLLAEYAKKDPAPKDTPPTGEQNMH